MANAEAAPASLGPRYAPDDPSLPQPWKGLIDGSTGVLYYWNPETNVTQYEKPTAAPPPLPAGPPPAASTPKLAAIPGTRAAQPTDIQSQQSPQPSNSQPPQGQQMNHSLQQQTQLMPQVAPQHGLQVAASGQLQGQFRPHMMQQPSHQVSPHFGQTPTQPGQQIPQAMQQLPPQLGHQAQIYPGGQPPSYQYPNQQNPYMAYQQHMPPQMQQTTQQQGQHVMQGQQFPQPENKATFPHRDEVDNQQGKQAAFPSPQFQQSGSSSAQNFAAGINPIQGQQVSQPGQATKFAGPSINMQQPASFGKMPQDGPDLHQQHAPRFQNNVGSGSIHSQQPDVPSLGPKMGYEENPLGRTGNEYYFNTSKDGPVMSPQQPKLAAIPMTRNQQEMRMGNAPLQNVPPGGFDGAARPPMHNMYSHPVVAAFPNDAQVRPPPAMMGHSDALHLSQVEVYRQKHEVTATGDNVPAPFMTFEATGFPPEILRELHFAGFTSPTPIQAQTWPIALQNRDIVAIAKTGSGKTLGYLMPAFIHLRRCRNNAQNGPTVLVLAPTRELATQIQDEAIKFGRSSRFSCTCLYGGAPKGPQLKELERGADIVVATPGRLNDILEMKRINFRQVSLLVLDEADRMLDMGFEPQIRKIVNEIPPRRQTLMYTATWPKEVRKIAGDLLVNPVQVNIGSVDELAANKSITQYVEVVPQMEKQRRLEQILRSEERGSKIIIFCSTKKLCDQLARNIGRNFGAAAIHGDKSQGERDWVLNQFRSGKCPILVATDVAARGLDIRDIRVVINFDFPTGIEDYVHRIGRTGRAGATGVAYTFFSEQDWKHAADLVKLLEGANQLVPPEVREMALRGGPSFSRDRGELNRFGSADGGGGGGGGRWDSGGRGGRGGGFGGRGGMREGGFGGRGEMREGGFGGRGGMRDGGFGGRGGFGMRDGFGGRGGIRDGNFAGRGGRDGGYGGPSGGRVGWDRNERGPVDRYNNMDGRGGGRGRGRGRLGSRRDGADRSRGRSHSSSPEKVRTWGYSRSRSSSRSRSRSRSYSRSRSRGRSWSRSRSPRRKRSYSRSRSRSRSRSHDRYERRPPRKSKFDQMDVPAPAPVPVSANVPDVKVPPEPGLLPMSPGTRGNMSPMSPGPRGNGFTGSEPVVPPPAIASINPGPYETGSGPHEPQSGP